MPIKIDLTYVARRLWPAFRVLATGLAAVLLLADSVDPVQADPGHEARFEGAILSISEATPLAVSLIKAAITVEEDERLLFLTVDLSHGWKTYWRLPGRFGLAPAWDWSGSSNVADLRVHYPAPALFEEAGGSSIGYDAPTVWPVVVSPIDANAPLDLDLSLSFGLCADLCIPETARFHVGGEGNLGVLPPLSRLAALAQRLPSDGNLSDVETRAGTSGAIYVLEGQEGQHVMLAVDEGGNSAETLAQAIQGNWPHDQPAILLHVIEPGQSIQSINLPAEIPVSVGE